MTRSTRDRAARVGEASAMLGGAALLSGSWLVVTATDQVPELEARVFEAVNGLPDVFRPVVWVPMQSGSYVGSLVAVATTGAFTRDRRLTVAVLVASQCAYWSAKGIKRLVARDRPLALLHDVHVRERATGLGYVSGHSAVAFALAAALAPSVPRGWRVPIFTAATVVALARVYAGVHLPLDVVGGAGIGLLTGAAASLGS